VNEVANSLTVVSGRERRGFACGRRNGRRRARGQCPVCTSVSGVLICVTVTDFVSPDAARSSAIFTARCTIVQRAVLRSHVVCLSVCLWRWWIMTT